MAATEIEGQEMTPEDRANQILAADFDWSEWHGAVRAEICILIAAAIREAVEAEREKFLATLRARFLRQLERAE